jgi:hypothetical protein
MYLCPRDSRSVGRGLTVPLLQYLQLRICCWAGALSPCNAPVSQTREVPESAGKKVPSVVPRCRVRCRTVRTDLHTFARNCMTECNSMQPKARAYQRKEIPRKLGVSAKTPCFSAFVKAERQGFEPWVPVRALRISGPVHSVVSEQGGLQYLWSECRPALPSTPTAGLLEIVGSTVMDKIWIDCFMTGRGRCSSLTPTYGLP